ncbi:phosphodiester glycosidase family protein [Actinomadura fibrosa]|uniref:Phosphodiester glycosidase family protein n=1 Tax=Actinomadura fibrosa TaxID=111802 RepID=A0ABW2Y090_9ACTN|nr:phosphodiester glycosidase family protein [Actinomadura fibrosa]
MRRTALAAAVLVGGLGFQAPPAWADPAHPAGAGPRFAVPGYQTAVPGESVEAGRVDRVVAPGIVRTTFDTFGRSGWTRAHVLNAALGGKVRAGLLGGKVTETRKLSEAADREGAVAGINGDFYDINETNAAIGPEIKDGVPRKGTDQRSTVATIGEDGAARLADVLLEGKVTLAGAVHKINALNAATAAADGITVYTDQWGPGLRTLGAATGPYTELVVSGSKVTAVHGELTTTPVPDGGLVIVGRGTAAATLAAAAKPGDAASLDFGLRTEVTSRAKAPGVRGSAPGRDTDSPVKPRTALGSNAVLVRDGKAIDLPPSTGNDALKPRTAIGWAEGGKRLLLVTVDGSANFSAGVTYDDMALLMARLGAHEAFMLDGGGSSDLVARTPGDRGVSVVNTPSDGSERPIPNGVGLFTAKGSGTLQGLDVRLGAARAFPGLTVDATAAGHDETYAAVDVPARAVTWNAGRVGTVRDGVLRATRPGTADVTARVRSVSARSASGRSASGRASLRVLGPLRSMAFGTPTLTLDAGGSSTVRVTGRDAEGFTAPIAPRDLSLSYDSSVLDVAPQPDGTLKVTGKAGADGTATDLTATVQGHTAKLPVSVGLQRKPLAEFGSGETWVASAARGTASVATVDGSGRPGAPDGNQALKLSYDFTGTSGTSAGYATIKPDPITLPAGTRRIGLWVNGDGKRHWLRATLRSQGTTNVPFTFAQTVDWTGWRWVEGTLPDGFSDPVTLLNIYIVETSNAAKDSGELGFDALTALVGRDTSDTSAPEADPFVLQQETIGRGRSRFAVLSDLHVSASGGASSFAAKQAKQALSEAVAAKPDFIVINGDFVDTNTPADFTFAESLLKETVPASIPVHWVPGNHESGATATGTLTNFTQVTGRPTHETFDHDGTRYITLNTTLGGLRTSDWSQVPAFKDALDKASRDRSVRSVVVFLHHPLRDPSGAGASQFSDQLEAGLVERWLTGFRETSGKPIALFTGHAHTAYAGRADGVLEVNTPAVGKTPYSSPEKGGFFGWMLVGASPRPGLVLPGRPNPRTLDWLVARSNPVIDRITPSVPATLAVGASASVSATGTSSGFGLTFPLRYPASVTWTGGRGLAIATSAAQARKLALVPGVIAVLDVSTGHLTAVRPGSTSLTVTSGSQSASVPLTVTR